MVKLASARESRMYGPRLARNRAEYINAGIYLFATVVLICGFASQLSREPKSGLVLLLIALVLIMVVNVHDLLAHLAGIDYRLPLMEFDIQLALVEFAVPVVQTLGSLLLFLGILFIFFQAEKGYGYFKLEKHAANMLIAGPVLWVLGSVHNACQIYERADGHVQILQQSVHIPFLMGSLLILLGAVLNNNEYTRYILHGIDLLGRRWVWLGPRRTGERKRKSVRGCIVDANLSVLALVVVKKGEQEIPGLTDKNLPRRLGPKRAGRIRKLFNLTKEDDLREFVVKRPVQKEGKKERFKAPKIQRLITPIVLQRKRHRIALKKRRCLARKEQAAEYAKLLAQRQKEAKVKRAEEVKRKRSASMRDSKSSSHSAPAK